MQYVPENGVYVYFRYNADQTVMIVMNTAKESKKVSPAKYAERTNGFTKMKDVISGKTVGLQDFTVESYVTGVYELIK